MTEHKHAEVLRAIADGKEVEWKWDTSGWKQSCVYNPITYPHFEWRIKPEPKPPIVEEAHIYWNRNWYIKQNHEPNVRFTFDPETKLPIKVELI